MPDSRTRRTVLHWTVSTSLLLAMLIAADARAQDTAVVVSSRQDAGRSDGVARGQAGAVQEAQPSTAAKTSDAKNKNTSKKKKAKKTGKSKPQDDTAPATDEKVEKVKTPKHPSWTPVPEVTIDFKARIESEMRASTPASGFENGQVEWQDRRIGIEGTAYKRFSFEVSRELGDDFEAAHDLSEKTAWRDVYVDMRVTKGFNLEVGRFKLPLGREETTGETNLDFVHRSLAARVLSPGRDVGIMAHGRLFDRRVRYQAGYFTRDGDNGRTSQTEGGRGAFAARLVVAPFASRADSALAPLEIGVATVESRIDNRLGLRGRTVFGDGVFFDRVYVNGQRHRLGLDAAWERGPYSVSAEYIIVADNRNAMGFEGDDLPNVTARAWYLAGTWALTGERKHGRLEPRHDLLRGGLGAVEASARVEELRFGAADYPGSTFGFPAAATLYANADYAATLGLNWYLNHYVKLQGNLVVEWIHDPGRSPSPSTDGRLVSPVLLLQFRF